jgi:hypothetical protein
MKKCITIFLLILSFLSASARQDLDCENILNQLIKKVEKEYPGFEEKTKDKRIYNNFKKEMIQKAKNTPDSSCLGLLREYLTYFKDHHLYISKTGQTLNKSKSKKYYQNIDRPIKRCIQEIKTSQDPLEGIWKTRGYKLGIIKNEQKYQAFIIEADTNYWKPGEIKFKLYNNNEADYYLRDHSLRETSYKLHEDCILTFADISSPFIRIKPEPELSENELTEKVNEIEGFYFKKLSEKTVLLKLSNFFYSNVKRIENLIDKNTNLLEDCHNLIIDIRNNPGGTDYAYKKLLPYICTNDIRMMGAEYLATPTLVNGLRKYMEGLPADKKYDKDRQRIRKKIQIYEAHMYEFVNLDSSDVYIKEINPIKESPEQIVVLINGGTASSGENFAYQARQSKKVKILGVPSGGVLDYGSTRQAYIGCKDYKLSIPTFRMLRLPEYPIDNIGLQPDIYLDSNVINWIKYAQDYLEN